jgi:UDP-N-acetylglucosamine diphosphorylase / glucose-1-phosphate thymidylyltransferase / UDP-N-acetylgalactosamine diphosphorylase / glucosamine-1-phosphate N-acetyltransferase / galactosamine-1-phosphate N-acetyltransferase
MLIVVFEDRQVDRLFPITTGRVAYSLTCGSYRLLDWLHELAAGSQATLRAVVRPHLAELELIDSPALFAPFSPGRPTLLVNARLVPSRENVGALREMIAAGTPGIVRCGHEAGAVLLAEGGSQFPTTLDFNRFASYLEQLAMHNLPPLEQTLSLFNWPHDAVRENMQAIGPNLEHRLARGGYREIADGVFAAEGAILGQYVVSDTRQGPIVLDEGASVGPYTFLRGPAYIGPRARIIEHSAIKDSVSIAHTVKIGGEVEASVIEPYTNKQHHGFLGHSYLGSWINLGAGTCNSDLKNTYGPVKMDYRGESVSTGMQFLGCIMGDYSKSAINTGIFTGKTVGACSMMYGFVTTNVPSFVNYARHFGQVTELTPEVMIATQQRMFLRRSVEQRECDAQLIRSMYELTRHERQLANEPLSL